MTAIEYITSVYVESITHYGPHMITDADAAETIANHRAEGLDIPSMVTPELLAALFNYMAKRDIAKQARRRKGARK